VTENSISNCGVGTASSREAYRDPVIGKGVKLFVVRSSKYILLTVGKVLPNLEDHRRNAATLPSLDRHRFVEYPFDVVSFSTTLVAKSSRYTS
jgi:hypothetical protein